MRWVKDVRIEGDEEGRKKEKEEKRERERDWNEEEMNVCMIYMRGIHI